MWDGGKRKGGRKEGRRGSEKENENEIEEENVVSLVMIEVHTERDSFNLVSIYGFSHCGELHFQRHWDFRSEW